MTILTQHAPGTFCWPELATTDHTAAKKFYSALFGWTANDMPMGPDAGSYTIFQKRGKDCAGMYTIRPDQAAHGMPPNWGPYVAVASADQSAKKAAELGAKVIMEPFDVMGSIGRMAVLQDPQGAMISIWQAKDSIGAGILDEPGALCWTELMTTDTDKASRFYTALFGWKAEQMPMEKMTYTVFSRPDGTKAAGMMPRPKEVQAPPHWINYFEVESAKDAASKVASAKGKVLVPPTEIPNIGTFAIFQDPQDAAFAVLQRAS